MHELVSIPNEFRDPLFTRLFLLAEINTFTAEEYKQYKKSLENMSELDNIINSTAELAEIRGREEGRKEGIYLAVKRMLDSGMSTEQVAAILQMSIDQVCQYSE